MSSFDNGMEKVPVFKSWRGWYGLVIVVLCVLIVLFYFFTKRFA